MSRCLSEGKCQQRGVRVPIFIDANADVLKAVSGRSFVCLNDSNSRTPWLSLLILCTVSFYKSNFNLAGPRHDKTLSQPNVHRNYALITSAELEIQP